MNAEEIVSIVTDQREEIERMFKGEKMIKREFLDRWGKTAKSSLIKVVTGVRRSGKSVFSLELLEGKNYGYINFDDERLAGLKTAELNRVLQAFYQLYGNFKFIFLDEVQNVEGWELFVNRLKRLGFNLLVTGSNARLLSKELATHLTGRYIPIEIFPFSFREFLMFEGFEVTEETFYSTRQKSLVIKKLSEYIKMGGFPEAIKDRLNARSYLSTLYSTILTKDVVSRYRIKFPRTIREISNYLVSNFSQPVSYNKIKNTFGLKSAHTPKKYVSYLEEAYLIFLVNKFSSKHKEVLASPKKVYAIDNGIIDALAFEASRNVGRLMENLVLIELLRKKATDGLLEIYYWRDYFGKEVDFLLKRGPKIKQLIQVTYASARDEIKRREMNALIKAGNGLKCKDLLMITWDYEAGLKVSNRKVKFIPLWKWLLKSK